MRARRGFLLIAVMALLILAIAMIAWSLNRMLFTSRAVDVRIQSYRDHHEMQGLKAITSRWFTAKEMRDAVGQIGREGVELPEYQAQLPNDTVITLRLTSGQGTILARLDEVSSVQAQEHLLSALRLIPADRGDLIRRHGPYQTSLVSAPPEVLLAFAGGDQKLADVLRSMQPSPPLDNGDLVRRIMAAGYPEKLGRDLTVVLTLETTLARVDAEVTDALGTRRYALLVGEQDGMPRIYECRRLEGREEALAGSEDREKRNRTGG